MDRALTSPFVERRRARRRRTVREHGISAARVRRGVPVTVLDASAGGVLIETGQRLLPGMPVEIHFERRTGTYTMRGRVLRCAVVHLTASSVSYRGAIAFDHHLPWLIEDLEVGSSFTAKGQ